MSAPRRTAGLGRGIGALLNLPEESERHLEAVRPSDVYFGGREQGEDLLPVPGLKLAALDVDAVRPNPRQPRRDFDEEAMSELVHSVRENGVLQPIVVRPLPEAGAYELVMGERRLRASREAGRRTIPAVVKDTADEQMLHDALLENLHRSQLNPLEEASAYQQLMADFGITHEELGDRIGRSRPTITNTVRLLKLPEHIQRKVAAGVITAGHAKAVLSVVEPGLMDRMVERIVGEDLNVRQAEAAAVKLSGPGKARKSSGRRYEQLEELEERLGAALDTRVRVDYAGRSGRIVIDFGGMADLNRILARLGQETFEAGEARERMLEDRRTR